MSWLAVSNAGKGRRLSITLFCAAEMLIRKNTKAFKTIKHLISACLNRADRDNLIRLYITKAGDSVQDRISVEGIEENPALFYEMTYQTVLNNLNSSNHQLQVSDEVPGIYFFHSSSNKAWDETPFEFDDAIKEEFSSLPDLPLVRKKTAPIKSVLPVANSSRKSSPGKSQRATKKQKAAFDKSSDRESPEAPDFKLKHAIQFSNLEELVFRQAKVTKRDVLQYYNEVAPHLLPWLKDRPLFTRLQGDGGRKFTALTIDALFEDNFDDMPAWIQTSAGTKKEDGNRLLLCNDKEHLLFYVQKGCLEFLACHSTTKRFAYPDYSVIAIASPDSGLEKARDVALAARDILTGLKLPSFIKADGISGFHIYIPLDAASGYKASQETAEHICKLLKLKLNDRVTLKESVYGKPSVDHLTNEQGNGIIAPYSLVAGPSPTVATPLTWNDVEKGVAEALEYKSVTRMIREAGDPFKAFFKRKVNARDLVESLDDNYGFLF